MIVIFEDGCWEANGDDWARSLLELLVALKKNDQHTICARPASMDQWIIDNMPRHVDYFRARLAAGQRRANSQVIRISPEGVEDIVSDPPWTLSAQAAYSIVSQPLRLMLENDRSDRCFIEATVAQFSGWCQKKWINPNMGGGSAMEKDIIKTADDPLDRWRSFYMFDSDRLHPSELQPGWIPPSGDGCQGYRFEKACANLPRSRWHRLDRRSIENYLPQGKLNAVNSAAATGLFRPETGPMVKFYNIKNGLVGDGIMPESDDESNQLKKAVRAARSQGFWSGLDEEHQQQLKRGFGGKVADEFLSIPASFSWPSDVLLEMDALSEALMDAM